MGRQINIELIDDLDGTALGGEGVTIHFAVNGTEYSIDLSKENADGFHDALAPYVKAGRKIASNTKRSAGRGRAQRASDTKAVRDWARDNGYEVSDRGRLPADIVEAFAAAH